MKFEWLLFVSVLVFLPVASWADTHTAASCSRSDVAEAYKAASAGDFVTIPAGNCSWSSGLTIAKAIILQGARVGLTKITNIGTSSLIKINLSSDVVVRITGIYFDNITNTDSRNAIDVNGKKDGSFGLTQLRIDHNTFNKGSRAIHTIGQVYGVIDNNNFINCNIAIGITGDNNYSWSRPIIAGTANALFIEDNTFTINNDVDSEPNEQIYHQEGGRTVTRYNTFNGTAYTNGNSLFFDSHGNQNYYKGNSFDFRGQPIIEVYNNEMYAYKSYRMVYFRGGSVLFYNNTMTTKTGSAPSIDVTEEEGWQTKFFDPLDDTWNAQDQIMNSFFWGNTSNGNAITDVSLGSESDSGFIKKDRDYFMHAPQSSGGLSTYTGRAGGDMTFSSEEANAYYPYTAYTYPHPLRVVPSVPDLR